MKRRDFLKAAALAASSHLVSPSAYCFSFDQSTTRRKRVAILGAGLAGLVSAFELRKLGHHVTVLEAQLRAGGRVHTLRGFSDGLYAEAGAGRIPDTHHLTLGWVKHFGLELEPFYPDSGADLTFNGKRVYRSDRPSDPPPMELSPEDWKRGLSNLSRHYYGDLLKRFDGQRGADWPPPELVKFDDEEFGALLHSRGASPDVVRYLATGFEDCSLFDFVQDSVHHHQQLSKIKGGNDRLPLAFARELTDEIQYGCAVQSLEQQEKKLRVVFSRSGMQQELLADRVICTLPFSVLRHIPVRPAWSPAKHDVIQHLSYGDVTRVSLQMRTRFWEKQGLNGFGMSLYPYELWHGTRTQPGPRGVLQAYLFQEAARKVGELAPEEQFRAVLRDLAPALPQAESEFEGGFTTCWHRDPWQKGAFAMYRKGEFQRFRPLIARPEGLIHFAGEHASNHWGWIQGALESGLRAVAEIEAAT